MSGGRPERFDEYVDRCLYDPVDGFYAAHGHAGGARGDFLTSPEVGPLFGLLVARYLDSVWNDLGRPERMPVVECGAGRGALANAILTSGVECVASLAYVTVERSERLRAEQRALLGDAVTIVASLDEVDDGAPIVGVILANELLDNLAFRLVVRDDNSWAEVYVVDGGPVIGDVAAPSPSGYVLPDAPTGSRLPLHDQAHSWVADALGRLEAGRLLLIDYGVTTTDQLIDRDWLRTYRGHDRGSNPFETPGTCDVTTDVAFDQLPQASSIVTQAEFLRSLGIDELVDEGQRIWAERAHLGDLAAIKARSRTVEAGALTDPSSLGAFLVAEWVAGVSADR